MHHLYLLLLLCIACKSDRPASAPKPTEPTAAPAVAPDPGSGSAAPITDLPGSANLSGLQGVFAEMGQEAANRPGARITTEKVFEALSKAGVTVAQPRQVLAKTARARYCMLATVPPGIGVAVCEYTNGAEAKAGREYLDANFKTLVPDAVRIVKDTTVITVSNASSNKELQRKILDTFEAL